MLILELLANGKRMPSAELEKTVNERGISSRTMRTAKSRTVYIEDDAYQITELREDTVQLLPTGMVYPIYRAERKEQFEQLLRADRRNAYYTEFLPIDPDKADQDLRDVLAHGLMDEADKKQLSTLLQSGRSNSEIAYWLSRAYPHEIETLNLETGDIAD